MSGVKELWIGVKKRNGFISHRKLMNILVLLGDYKMNVTKIVKGQLILTTLRLVSLRPLRSITLTYKDYKDHKDYKDYSRL